METSITNNTATIAPAGIAANKPENYCRYIADAKQAHSPSSRDLNLKKNTENTTSMAKITTATDLRPKYPPAYEESLGLN